MEFIKIMNSCLRKIVFSALFTLTGLLSLCGQQPVRMKTGDLYLSSLTDSSANGIKAEMLKSGLNYISLLLQFESLPSDDMRRMMSAEGLDIFDYIPENTYYAVAKNEAVLGKLNEYKVERLAHLKPEWKTDMGFWRAGAPSWCRSKNDSQFIFVSVFYHDKAGFEHLSRYINSKNYKLQQNLPVFRNAIVGLPEKEMSELLKSEGLQWVEPISPPIEAHNLPGRINHRSLPLNNPGPGAGKNLWGKGIVIGEWDGAGAGSHVDYNDRVILKQKFVAGSNGNHATHVCGTITGGGIIDPFAQGMAPKATLFSWDFGGSIASEMDTAAWRDSVVMTNNSYGYGSDPCPTRGTYDGQSRNMDILVNMYPYLSHQFSSGNSRSANCATGGYKTVQSGYQSAKNNITVGALTFDDQNSSFHSYGPVRDGRLKPEICAVGVNVYSTMPGNSYQGGWNGTSMSCPGSTGTIAQIHERFKQLNSGRKPFAHTLKAIVCNTADDIGNAGPDYAFGFGRINAISAVKAIEDKTFKVDSVSNGNVKTDTVYVKAGTGRLQVMLVWDDVPAAVSAAPALVNDLDLEVLDSLGNLYRPWTLNPTCHTCLPTRRRDSLNNTEQFYIDNPASGKWVIRVRGKLVSAGNEAYTVSTLQINRFVRVAYPNGHENMLPPTSSNPQTITWDAFGTTGTFSIEYSVDSGTTWTGITSGLSNAARFFTWNNAPSTLSTRKALIRITNGTARDVSDTTFHIFLRATQPSAVTCNRQIHLFWPRTTGATRYRVFQSVNSFMEQIGITSDTFFTVFNLINGRQYWFSLQAIGNDGQTGPRTNGVAFTPTATPLPPSITDHPDTTLVCANAKLTLISASSGTAPLSRQWQYSADNGKTWQNSTGANKDTLTFLNFPWSQKDYLYRNQYVNICRNLVFTKPALVRVDSPAIFRNKLPDTTMCEGDSLKLSLNIGFNGRLSMQWQRSINGGATWNDLPGDTLNSLRRIGLMFADNQSQFRMVVSNVCHSRRPSDTAILTVRPPLQLTAPRDTLICKGATITLKAIGSGGDVSKYKYQWAGFAPGNSITVAPTAKTIYTVSLDDQCGYKDAFDTVVVDVRQGLSATVSNDTTICLGRSARLSAQLSGGFSPTYNYSWTPGNLVGASIVVAPTSTTTYRLRAVDGCTPDSIIRNIKVTVRPALDLQISKDTLICNGRTVNLKTTSAGGLAAGYTINWNQSLGTGPSKTVSPSTITIYRAILTDGCTVKPDTAFVTVDVRAPLQLRLNKDTTICKGKAVQLTASISGGLSSSRVINWNQGLGTGLTHNVTPSAFTQYHAVLSDACTVRNDTQRINITVRPDLDVKTNADTTLCFGNSITLNSFSTGGTGSYAYTWQNTAAPTPTLGSSSSLNLSPTASMNVRVIISDGCTVKPDTAAVQINLLPDLSLSIGPDTSICAGTQASLRGRTKGGKGNYTYRWTELPGGTTVGNDSNLLISPSATTTYNLNVEDGCSANKPSKNVIVTVVNMPVATLFTNDYSLCDPAEFLVKNNSSNAVRFRLNNKNYSGADTLFKLNTGFYNLDLRTFNSLGCSDTSTIYLQVFPSPKAGFSINPNPPRENDLVNFTDLSSGADFWNWYLPHGNFTGSAVLPWLAKDTGVHYLRQVVSNNFGCFDSADMTVKVGPGFFLHIPTAFTPDENGVNDVWLPKVHGIRNYRLQIFNRWGQMVFNTTDPQKGWDGLNAIQGQYAFVISGISSYEVKILETGSFTLLR